jgi:hypothetical protein
VCVCVCVCVSVAGVLSKDIKFLPSKCSDFEKQNDHLIHVYLLLNVFTRELVN